MSPERSYTYTFTQRHRQSHRQRQRQRHGQKHIYTDKTHTHSKNTHSQSHDRERKIGVYDGGKPQELSLTQMVHKGAHTFSLATERNCSIGDLETPALARLLPRMSKFDSDTISSAVLDWLPPPILLACLPLATSATQSEIAKFSAKTSTRGTTANIGKEESQTFGLSVAWVEFPRRTLHLFCLLHAAVGCQEVCLQAHCPHGEPEPGKNCLWVLAESTSSSSPPVKVVSSQRKGEVDPLSGEVQVQYPTRKSQMLVWAPVPTHGDSIDSRQQ